MLTGSNPFGHTHTGLPWLMSSGHIMIHQRGGLSRAHDVSLRSLRRNQAPYVLDLQVSQDMWWPQTGPRGNNVITWEACVKTKVSRGQVSLVNHPKQPSVSIKGSGNGPVPKAQSLPTLKSHWFSWIPLQSHLILPSAWDLPLQSVGSPPSIC